MKRRLLTTALITVMVLSAAACGKEATADSLVEASSNRSLLCGKYDRIDRIGFEQQ